MLENEVTLGTQLSSGLEIIGLSKLFKKREVVKDISFSMKQGEVIGLLGPNGAGKTTCFYMICGLIKSDRGKIFLHGNDITHMVMYQRSRQGIGYLPQEMSIFRGLTVAQNINASLEVSYNDKEERKRNLDRLLEEFSLSHLANSNALSLSGGERRRVEIARALASNPDFILLDEPFAGVDPIAIDGIRELVRTLVQRGIGVLITDHNVRETLDIIDFGHIMYDGAILTSGTPKEILDNDAAQQVYLGKGFNR